MARRWPRFLLAETLAGGLFAIVYLLCGTRGFTRWRDASAATLAGLPRSLTDPLAPYLCIGVGAAGAVEGLAFAVCRLLLPRRPEVAGPLFSCAFVLMLSRRTTRDPVSNSQVPLLRRLQSCLLFRGVLAAVERVTR